MIKKLSKSLIIAALLLCSQATAEYYFPEFSSSQNTDMLVTENKTINSQISIRPSFSKIELKKKTLKEKANLFSVSLNYDLIVINNIYVSAQLSYKFSKNKGKTNSLDANNVFIKQKTYELYIFNRTKSKYSDFSFETKLGYTFSLEKNGYVIPYLVLGYENEENNYISPSPMIYKSVIDYEYLGFGMISKVNVNSKIFVSLNTKIIFMFNAKTKIDNTSYILDKYVKNYNYMHYEIELPISYAISNKFLVSIAPIYSFKQYKTHKYSKLGTEKMQMKKIGAMINAQYNF